MGAASSVPYQTAPESLNDDLNDFEKCGPDYWAEARDTPSNALSKYLSQVKVLQNHETKEIIHILAGDSVDDIPNIDRDEWFEVPVSGLQEEYTKKCMKINVPLQVSNVLSLSSGQGMNMLQSNSITANLSCQHSDGVIHHQLSEESMRCQSVKSGKSLKSDRTSCNSAHLIIFDDDNGPKECPYCNHIFTRLENKKAHINECRLEDEQDTENINIWIHDISQDNAAAMSTAMTEALTIFEEKVYHRKEVTFLLKRLQKVAMGTLEQMKTLHAEMLAETKELEALVVPTTQKSPEYIFQKNSEINTVLDYLNKSIDVLNRKISSRKNFQLEDFTVGKAIGKGSFAKVYMAKRNENNAIYALKVIKKSFMKEQNMELQIQRERVVMENTNRYPDIFLRLYFHEIKLNNILIMMEYVPTGDCLALMNSLGGKLSLELSKHIVASVVVAISFLHIHGVVHRDIKPDNLLITPQGHIKLVDFGMCGHYAPKGGSVALRSDGSEDSLWFGRLRSNSTTNALVTETDPSTPSYKFGNASDDMMKTMAGNANYAAPEVLGGDGYDNTVDWWAVGVLYFHLLAGVTPFAAHEDAEIKCNVLGRCIGWEHLPKQALKACQGVIEAFLDLEPLERLGAKGDWQIKEHEHFADYDFDSLFVKPGPHIPARANVIFEPNEENIFK